MIGPAVPYRAAHEALAARVGPEALAHCERAGDTAAALAERFGADVETARLAGLLHDWGREMGDEALLRSAGAHGIAITEADRAVPYLLHAAVSSAELADTFPGLGADVLHAIACHTFGCADMSPFDKIVYLGDTLEPGRMSKGVEQLREAAERDGLDAAFEAAFVRSVERVVKHRRPIHPQSVDAWNTLVARSR